MYFYTDDASRSRITSRTKVVFLIGRSKFSTITEALPMTWVMTRRQNGILRSFLRCLLAGKTAQASRNVDCFLKLSQPDIAYLFDLKTEPFPHALNITILMREKEIIGGWFYVKPSTCIKSECVFELYRISTESTFAIPYMQPSCLCFFFFFWCCMKMDKNHLFQEGPHLKPKKSCQLIHYFFQKESLEQQAKNPEYYH